MTKKKESEAGKGDKLRGGFSRQYRSNYDTIEWENTDKCLSAPNVRKNSKKQA